MASESSLQYQLQEGRAPRKVVLAGGSGFLGRLLSKWYSTLGWEVVTLSRSPASAGVGSTSVWDGETLGDWVLELEGARALINLAGRSVNCRYHRENRRRMMDSRILSTRILGQAVESCSQPPKVWLNSSTATIYKHTYGLPHDEAEGVVGATPEANDAFSVEIAQAWEGEFNRCQCPRTRKILLRTAMVFGSEPGGVHEVLRLLTKVRLGGRMGDGRQFVSWIHSDDFCRAVAWLVANPGADGVYNLASPNPVPNSEMMAAFRRTYRRSFGLPAARWMLEVGAFLLRTETELIIKSRNVVPARLLDEGFEFRHPEIEQALASLKSETRREPSGPSYNL